MVKIEITNKDLYLTHIDSVDLTDVVKEGNYFKGSMTIVLQANKTPISISNGSMRSDKFEKQYGFRLI